MEGDPQIPKDRKGLIVMIAGASNLRNADWNPLSSEDKSDPYCTCQVQCHSGPKTFETKAVDNSLSPVWNHVELLPDYEHGHSLVFTIYDKDTFSRNDELGKVELPCDSFHPWGFTGKLPLTVQGDESSNACVYVMVMATPICSGELRVLKSGTEVWRFFVLVEDTLLYFLDSDEFERGEVERGRIMLNDVERVKLDEDNSLVFHIGGASNYDIKFFTKDWKDAQKWGLACERALLLGGVEDLAKYLQMPFCEGLLTPLEGSTEAPLYFVLHSDTLWGYEDFAAYRDSQDPTRQESLKEAPSVTIDDSGVIMLAWPGKSLKLRTGSWEAAQHWGPAFRRALAAQGAENKVNWEHFAKMPVIEGTMAIIKGATVVPRYFVLYVDRIDYFKDEKEFRSGTSTKHGAIPLKTVLKVIRLNDAIITITLTGKKVFQLQESEVGSAQKWAEAFNKVLLLQGSGAAVVGHMESWVADIWEETMDDVKKQAEEEKRKA